MGVASGAGNALVNLASGWGVLGRRKQGTLRVDIERSASMGGGGVDAIVEDNTDVEGSREISMVNDETRTRDRRGSNEQTDRRGGARSTSTSRPSESEARTMLRRFDATPS